MNSRRAALPRSSHAHGSGAGPWRREREVDQPGHHGVVSEAEHPTEIARRHAGAHERDEQLRQVRDRPLQSRLIRRPAGSCGAARSGSRRRGRAGRPPTAARTTRSPSTTTRCSTPAASMSTVASIASWRIGTVGAGTRASARTGASSETPSAATPARTSASVTMPRPSPSSRHQQCRHSHLPQHAGPPSGRWRRRAANTGGRMIADTGVVPTSWRPWTVCPARVSRLRIVRAT